MSYDPATVRAVCKALRVAAVPGHPWQGAADFIESRFPAEPPPPEPSTDTLRGTLERLGTFNECVRIYMQHRDAGYDVRPGWLEEEVAATDVLLARLPAEVPACHCIYSEHCDSRLGCRLAAGGTVNEGGGVCSPTEAPAPEPSTDWTCPACGVLGDRQSCRNCGAECRPAEPSTDTLREALESLAAKLGIVATDFELDGHERAAAQFRELVAEANEALAATPAREDDGTAALCEYGCLPGKPCKVVPCPALRALREPPAREDEGR